MSYDEKDNINNPEDVAKINSISALDPASLMVDTHVTSSKLSLAAFGCGGTGSKWQNKVAWGIKQLQDQFTCVEYLGDMEYHDDGVAVDDERRALQQFNSYVTNYYRDNLVYKLLIGNHEVLCQGRGPKDFNEAKHKADAIQRTTQQEDSTIIEDGHAIKKFRMPARYYLEKVYGPDNNPLALLLHIDSSLLPGDTEQQWWLKGIANKIQANQDNLGDFPQKVLLSHHSVFFSPDKRGQVIKEKPKYPHDQLASGNHHRVLGRVLADCGLSLKEWILLGAHIHTTAVIESYNQQNSLIPKLQAMFGGGGSAANKKDYLTMVPGLTYTNSGYGYGGVELFEDGSFTIKYYDCTHITPEDIDEYGYNITPKCLWQRHYNKLGQPAYDSNIPNEPNHIHPLLFENTQKIGQYKSLLLHYIENQAIVDWRSLTWSIIAITDWGNAVQKQYLSAQLFKTLLQSQPQPDRVNADNKKLSIQLLDEQLNGIQAFFDYYTSQAYQAHYTTFFTQLAFWHQALQEIRRLILKPYANRRRISSMSDPHSVYDRMHDWLQGDLQIEQPHEEDELSDEDDEMDRAAQVPTPSDFNEFDAPDLRRENRSHPEDIGEHDLDHFINPDKRHLFINRLKKACYETLRRSFGPDWQHYEYDMENYNAFGLTYLVMALIDCDPVQALSSLFSKYPYNFLSYKLEHALDLCYRRDLDRIDNNQIDDLIFDFDYSTEISFQEASHGDKYQQCEQRGAIFRALVKNKKPCWQHLLDTESYFNLVRHPLVREQIVGHIGWDLDKMHHRMIQDGLKKLTKIYAYPRLKHLCMTSEATKLPNKALFEQLQLTLEQINHWPNSIDQHYPEARLLDYIHNQKGCTYKWHQETTKFIQHALNSNEDGRALSNLRLVIREWPTMWCSEDNQQQDEKARWSLDDRSLRREISLPMRTWGSAAEDQVSLTSTP